MDVLGEGEMTACTSCKAMLSVTCVRARRVRGDRSTLCPRCRGNEHQAVYGHRHYTAVPGRVRPKGEWAVPAPLPAAFCAAPSCGLPVLASTVRYREQRGIVSDLCPACRYRGARLASDRRCRARVRVLEAELAETRHALAAMRTE